MTDHHCRTGYHDQPADGCYSNHRCRCAGCRRKHSDTQWQMKRNRRRKLEAGADVEHGSASTYTNWMCRCRPCTDAMTAAAQPRVKEAAT